MELLMQVKGSNCNDREEEEDEEELEIEEEEVEAELTREEISNTSKHQYHQHPLHSANNYKNSWLGLHDHHSPDATTDSPNSSSGLGLGASSVSAPSSNFPKIDLMDLSLAPGIIGNRSSKDVDNNEELELEEDRDNTNIEKEHMFDKVVTPSDVGKLNRLVIPKQHAEKYFPLDSSSNEKGLLLNFEDRNGKLWRFRYSYWNSSQSYVMTKGWSRFVKEKKLDAGDIVSFHRGAAETYRHRLYIDWRRRPDHHHHAPPGASDSAFITPFLFHHHHHPNHLSPQYSIRWSSRLYSPPLHPPPSRPPQLNYSNMFPFQQDHQRHHPQVHNYNVINSGSGSSMYPNLIGQREQQNVPMIIDSVPVDHYHHHHHLQHHQNQHQHGKSSSTNATTAGKRLRLFGVNMECASSPSSSADNSSIPSSSMIPPPLQYLRMPHEDPISLSSSSASARFHQKVGTTSMLFDLDPSLQYRQ